MRCKTILMKFCKSKLFLFMVLCVTIALLLASCLLFVGCGSSSKDKVSSDKKTEQKAEKSKESNPTSLEQCTNDSDLEKYIKNYWIKKPSQDFYNEFKSKGYTVEFYYYPEAKVNPVATDDVIASWSNPDYQGNNGWFVYKTVGTVSVSQKTVNVDVSLIENFR